MTILVTIALIALFGWAIAVLLESIHDRQARHRIAMQRLNEPQPWEWSNSESGWDDCADESAAFSDEGGGKAA